MVQKVAVIGAGLMGGGIAQVSAQAGYDVILRDVTPEALERGLGAIRTSYDRFVDKNRMSAEDRDAALARITPTTELADVAPADLVVEAVFEKLEVKAELFAELDRICGDGTTLASNTSAIPITSIAAATTRPERVVGTHFFSPVPMMKLCELVRGYKTSDEALAVAREFAEGVDHPDRGRLRFSRRRVRRFVVEVLRALPSLFWDMLCAASYPMLQMLVMLVVSTISPPIRYCSLRSL